MNRFLSLSLALLLCWSRTLAAQGDPHDGALTLENRERTLRFTLLTDGDAPEYRVDRLTPDGATNVILDRSPLGITRMHEDFTTGLEFVSASPPIDLTSVYRMVTGKQLDIRRRVRQRTFTFRNTSGATMTITARAMRDGVAFRYGFPRAAFAEDSVTGEATGFHLPLGGSAWMQPYQRASSQARAYESDYRNALPIGAPAPDRTGWALPMLFHANDAWVLITEAALDRTSYGVHIERRAEGGLYRVRLPEEDETNGVAAQAAAITFPWLSPWRVVIVGPTLATIVESTAVTDLSPAPITTDVAWIKPGRASSSWWSDTTSARDYQKLFPFVGLASQMRWEYSSLGNGWREMGDGGDVSDLLDYAKARNVGLTLWYSAGGAGNDGPDAGSSLMTDPDTRRAELKRIAALGVKGITVDVMQSDKQSVIGLYEDILRDAAANHLFVDFHGSTIPRGWQRTFPNLLSMAAVRGAEQYGDSLFDENAALFNTIYPFTRNVIGPMDYTPMIFGNVPGRFEHLTTNPHELALSVVFESGLQHFVSTPAMIDAQPEYVKEFLRVVPTVWDETRYVDGYPGRFVVLARRRGPDWYVGAITADTLVSVVEVPLHFLGAGPYYVGLISDGDDYDQFASNAETLTNRDTVTVELAPRGGFVAQIRPIGAAPPTPPAKKPAAVRPTPAKPTPTPPRATKPRVPPRREP